MLNRFNSVVQNLVVHEKNMEKNTNLFGGIIYSQKVLLKLTEKGLTREQAYEIVQKNALNAIDNDLSFKENLLRDDIVREKLSIDEINECFSAQDYLKYVDRIFAKF